MRYTYDSFRTYMDRMDFVLSQLEDPMSYPVDLYPGSSKFHTYIDELIDGILNVPKELKILYQQRMQVYCTQYSVRVEYPNIDEIWDELAYL